MLGYITINLILHEVLFWKHSMMSVWFLHLFTCMLWETIVWLFSLSITKNLFRPKHLNRLWSNSFDVMFQESSGKACPQRTCSACPLSVSMCLPPYKPEVVIQGGVTNLRALVLNVLSTCKSSVSKRTTEDCWRRRTARTKRKTVWSR